VPWQPEQRSGPLIALQRSFSLEMLNCRMPNESVLFTNNKSQHMAAALRHLNVRLLPHIGSATIETRDAMGYKALDNLDAVLLKHTNPPDMYTRPLMPYLTKNWIYKSNPKIYQRILRILPKTIRRTRMPRCHIA
jgi:hypothetical protein